jgi:hypothetical protein
MRYKSMKYLTHWLHIWTGDILIANDFAFFSGSVIHDTEASELKKQAADLAKKYTSDLNGYEFSVEIKSFKYTASSISKDLTLASPLWSSSIIIWLLTDKSRMWIYQLH